MQSQDSRMVRVWVGPPDCATSTPAAGRVRWMGREPLRPLLTLTLTLTLTLFGACTVPVHAAPASGPWANAVADQLGVAWSRATDLDAWQAPAQWRVVASPYTHHWRPNPEHRHVVALGLERESDDHWMLGGSLFRNSFGQPSTYLYMGRRTEELLGVQPLFLQWSAGLLYGYRGKYQSKVPLNLHGFAPGAVLSLGWQFDRQLSVTAHALGDAGVMLQLGYTLR